jgi:hypothetical protein
MPLPADDLAWMIRDSGGLLATLGAAQTYAHRDVAHAEVAERLQVHVPVYRFTFPAGALPGIRAGSAVTVGGTAYRVKEAASEEFGDGAMESWYAVEA